MRRYVVTRRRPGFLEAVGCATLTEALRWAWIGYLSGARVTVKSIFVKVA